MVHTLRFPEYLTLTAPDGTLCRGADQLWFRSHWQRRAGCGPTTAAVLLSYLAATRQELAALAPDLTRTTEGFLSLMEEVWRYVLPGAQGLDKPESFLIGCRSFAFSKGLQLTGEILSLPPKGVGLRPSLAWCRDFVLTSLAEDRPLAFLNYSSGKLEHLDDWHWVPVVAAEEEEGRFRLLVLDGGQEKSVDFPLWWNTSLAGGAFVSLAPLGTSQSYTVGTEGEGENFLCALSDAGGSLTVRLNRGHPPEHWLVSWPCALLDTDAFVLTGLTPPRGETDCARISALLEYTIRESRARGGRALRLSVPAEEEALAALCRALGFRQAASRTQEKDLCFLEKEL